MAITTPNPFLSIAGASALASASATPPSGLQGGFTGSQTPPSTYGFPKTPTSAITSLFESPAGFAWAYPNDLSTTKYWMQFGINQYQRQDATSVGTLNPLGMIYLPLAEQLVDAATVTYEEIPMGALGAGVMDIGNGRPSMDTLKGAAQGVGAALMAQVDQLGQTAGGALGLNLGQSIAAKGGIQVNQYMTIMLRGPSYRVREFSWKFSPRNAQETTNLISILNQFKASQAVSYATSASYAFFSWPNIFQIQFSNQSGSLASQLYAFKPAVLNDFVVNYTGAGSPAFYGATSAPVSYQVMARFTEVEYWLASDYQGTTTVPTPGPSTTTTPVNAG